VGGESRKQQMADEAGGDVHAAYSEMGSKVTTAAAVVPPVRILGWCHGITVHLQLSPAMMHLLYTLRDGAWHPCCMK
jgi:hypothetical protein